MNADACPSCGEIVAEGVPHVEPKGKRSPVQDAKITFRLTSAQLARAKRNHAKGFARHGLSFSAWIVARLMAEPK